MPGAHGAFVERVTTAADRLGRAGVSWTQLAVRLPDDGTGALPLLRRVILDDDKASTYKRAKRWLSDKQCKRKITLLK